MSSLKEIEKAINSRASLDRSPKKNWVERAGGLPMYIRRIANHLHQEKGMMIGHAISVAVNAVKKMCATGDLNWHGVQHVNPKSHAEACGAVADWERKKAQARVSKGELGRKWTDDEFIEFLVNETDIHKAMDCGCDETPKKKKRKKVVEKACGGKKKKKKIEKLGISNAEFEVLEKLANPDHPDTFEFDALAEIEKMDDEQRLVFGWCSIARKKDGEVVVDKQGDVLEDIDQMEKVAYDFVLHSRDGGEMHVRKGVSTLVESFVSTKEKWDAMGIPEGVLPVGWWVGFKVQDANVWKGVKEGKYRMFSVHGSGLRKAMEE